MSWEVDVPLTAESATTFEPYIDASEQLFYVRPDFAYQIDDLDRWQSMLDRVKVLNCDHAKLIECMLGPGTERTWAELNIEHAELLEQLRPGSVALLQTKFNLEHFARYPMSVLLELYDSRMDRGPWGLIVYAKSDHNDALYHQPEQLTEMHEKLSGKLNLRIVESDNTQELTKHLSELKEEFGEASFLVVCGHGTKDGLTLGGGGEDHESLQKESPSTMAFADSTRSFLTEGAEICMLSCSTGKADGIGQSLSEQTGATVSAPESDTALDSFGVELNGDKVSFKPVYTSGNAARFQEEGSHKPDEESTGIGGQLPAQPQFFIL